MKANSSGPYLFASVKFSVGLLVSLTLPLISLHAQSQIADTKTAIAFTSNSTGSASAFALNSDSSVSILQNGAVAPGGCAAFLTSNGNPVSLLSGSLFFDTTANRLYIATGEGGGAVTYETFDVNGNCTLGPVVPLHVSFSTVVLGVDLVQGNVYVLIPTNGAAPDSLDVLTISSFSSYAAGTAIPSVPLDYSATYGPIVIDSSTNRVFVNDFGISTNGPPGMNSTSGLFVYDPKNSAIVASNIQHVAGYLNASNNNSQVLLNAQVLMVDAHGKLIIVNQNTSPATALTFNTSPFTILDTTKFSFFTNTKPSGIVGISPSVYIEPPAAAVKVVKANLDYSATSAATIDAVNGIIYAFAYDAIALNSFQIAPVQSTGALFSYSLSADAETPLGDTIAMPATPNPLGYWPWTGLTYNPQTNSLVLTTQGALGVSEPIACGAPVGISQVLGSNATNYSLSEPGIDFANGYTYDAETVLTTTTLYEFSPQKNCFAPKLSISPTTLPNGAINLIYPAVTFSATGGTGSISFATQDQLPANMSLSSAGVLQSQVPLTQTGTFNFVATALDQSGNTGSQFESVYIRPATTISFSSPPCSVNAAPLLNNTVVFAPVAMGTTGTQNVCINNTGPNTFYLQDVISFSFPVFGFSFVSNACNILGSTPPNDTNSLAGGSSCMMTFGFTPKQPQPYNASQLYNDNAGSQTLNFSASGFIPSADLAITGMTTSPATGLVQGTNFAIQITVHNYGPNAADVTVTDTLPAQLVVAASPGCTYIGQTVTCTAPTLQTNTSETVTINVHPNSTGTNISDSATVTSSVSDPNLNNNSNSVTFTIASGGVVGGAPCLCGLTGSYVAPSTGVGPAAGASSPHNKYTLSATPNGSLVSLIVTKGNTTVLNQNTPTSSTWGFSPDDDRFVIDNVSNSTESITLYNLAAGSSPDTWSTSQTLGVAGNNQSPSQLFFSNSGAYLAYVALLPNSSSTQIQLVNAISGKPLFTSSALSWVTVAGTGEDQFGVASFGFSPGKPEASFIYAYVSNLTQTSWDVIALTPNTGKITANSAINLQYSQVGYWLFSPCGDILGVIQQPSQSSVEATLYLTSNGKQFYDNSNLALGPVQLSSTGAAQEITPTGATTPIAIPDCPAPPTIPPHSAQLTTTLGTLTTDPSGSYIVPLTIQNTGGIAANNAALSSASVSVSVNGKVQTTATSSTLPVNLGSLAPGASQTATITFPAAAGVPQSAALLKLAFSFTGGSTSTTLHATLP
jgi:hypothetical protein